MVIALLLPSCQNTTPGPGAYPPPKPALEKEYTRITAATGGTVGDLHAARQTISSLMSQGKIINQEMLDALSTSKDWVILESMRLKSSEGLKDASVIADLIDTLKAVELKLQERRAQKVDEMLRAKIEAELSASLNYLRLMLDLLNRLYAIDRQTGDIYEYSEGTGSWTNVGEPGKMFAVDFAGRLFSLSVGGKSVYRYDNQPMKWTQIGGAAAKIYAGGTRLFTTNPRTGDIYEYGGNTDPWTRIGGPGEMFSVDAQGQLYGLSVGGNSVYRYDNQPMKWTQIGGAAAKIYAGGNRLFATNPQTGDIYGYSGDTDSWTRIGGPGEMFSVGAQGQLYGLSVGGKSIYRYDNQPMKWSQIGGAAATIYARGLRLFATDTQKGTISMYDAWTGAWTNIGGAGKMFISGADNGIF